MNIKQGVTIMLCGYCKTYYCETEGVQSFQKLTEEKIQPKIAGWKKKGLSVSVRRFSGSHLYKLKCPVCRTLPDLDPPA